MKKVLNNLGEMSEFAADIAGEVCDGQILALEGDLGSGKTTFTKFFAEALGITNPVTSPTFTIMKKYEIEATDRKMVHVDCYRLANEDDAISIGLEEYFADGKSICVIEWPEKISKLIPKERTKTIMFKYIDENSREVEYR
ncbi:MAG: tRNA (adenosine(37)-N6)-threonylcarbamoyltransferase complex ATPase subunit type 1 TsaE [Patescibacteria group bacterium]|jgi:tRNA threonylcarbamoyladenosine biosynthesis protein TsaE